ncbi:hypothetical protein AB4407_13270 [Vibrio sp. 10N.261.46.E11]|uniref:hypothetical protein n=1 Tax=Vibrio sp. 10N.261.46.E11 TaxID=3229662 RepID=UPI00355152C2
MFQQGDLCPHCVQIIVTPTDLQAECLGCDEEIKEDRAGDYDQEESIIYNAKRC